MDAIASYNSDDENNSCNEEDIKSNSVNLKTCPISQDYFGLNESCFDEMDNEADNEKYLQVSRKNVLNEKDISRKNDGEFEIDMLINAHELNPQSYGPSLAPDAAEISKKCLENTVLSCRQHFKRNRTTNENIFNKYSNLSNLTGNFSAKKAKIVPTTVRDEETQNSTNIMYKLHPKIEKHLNQCNKCIVPKALQMTFHEHKGCINRLQWCNSYYSHLLLSASMDKTVKIWDVFEAKCVKMLTNHSQAVKSAQWNLDGSAVLSGGYDKKARLSDIQSGKELSVHKHQHFVMCVLWHPTEQNLFLTGSTGKIELWDRRQCENKAVQSFDSNFGQVQDIIFLAGGFQFICSTDLVTRDSADRTIMAWDLKTSAILSNQIFQERYTCPSLTLHPSGDPFVAQTQGNYMAEFSSVRPYKMNKNKRFENHKVSSYAINCEFSQDGKYIASGSADGSLYFYYFKDATVASRIKIFPNDVCMCITLHPVLNSTIAVSDSKGQIQVWT